MNPAFKPGTSLGVLVGTALIALLAASPVQAQAGNLPYQSGGPGMSVGARQAILNSRLLDSRPRNLLRGPDGSLLELSRRGSQAFVRSPDSGAFIPGARPGRGWATGLGTGLGWGGGGGFGGGASYRTGTGGAAPADSVMQWISMLDLGAGRYYGAGSSLSGGRGTPLDQWIGQGDLG